MDSRFTNSECERLLGCSRKEVKVVKKGARILQKMDFETFCGLPYLSSLFFKSRSLLHLIISQAPWTIRWRGIKEHYSFYRDQIWRGYVADVTIAWIDRYLGYGVYANENFASGSFIGSYTGSVRHLNRSYPDHNVYCLHYPTRFWSYRLFVIDAALGGNEMRFVNHSNRPNMEIECLYDRGLLLFFLRTNQAVCKGSALTVNYGETFWANRLQSQIEI